MTPDDAYLEWLYSLVVENPRTRNPRRSYWRLIRQLYTTEFVWFVPNDDNRAADGRELRFEFMELSGLDADQEWLDLNCSMLEMLIALSRRLTFEAEGQPRAWFWHLLRNINLHEYDDSFKPFPEQYIGEVLDVVVWRTYREDGVGGLFPLKRASRNQREVELWYQKAAYLLQ